MQIIQYQIYYRFKQITNTKMFTFIAGLGFKVLEYLQKTKTLENNFFSWSGFWYWTKVKTKYVFY